MTRAYSYVRISSAPQALNTSIRRQREAAERYAQAAGLELDDSLVLTDEGISAYRGDNLFRGSLARFRQAVERGAVPADSYLLIESLDRFSRMDPWDVMPVFHDLLQSGIRIVTLQDGRVWSREEMRENPWRILESLVAMIRANEESRVRSKRMRAALDAKRQAARRGELRVAFPRVPPWLCARQDRSGYDLIPDRAATVQHIYELAADGFGPKETAAKLASAQIPYLSSGDQPGSGWSARSVARVLDASAAASGVMIPHTIEAVEGRLLRAPAEPIPEYFPAAVSAELADRVQLLRSTSTNPARGLHAGHGRLTSLLGGLARCIDCGGPVTRKATAPGRSHKRPHLICYSGLQSLGCRCVFIDQAAVEEALLAQFRSPIREWNVPAGDAVDPGFLKTRLRALERSARFASPNLSVLNARLRALLVRVNLDHEAGNIHLIWRQGGESSVGYGEPGSAIYWQRYRRRN